MIDSPANRVQTSFVLLSNPTANPSNTEWVESAKTGNRAINNCQYKIPGLVKKSRRALDFSGFNKAWFEAVIS